VSLEPRNGSKELVVHLMHRKAASSVSLCVCCCESVCSVCVCVCACASKNRELDEDSQMTREVEWVRVFSSDVVRGRYTMCRLQCFTLKEM
jgi:hypothetical protein